jgi:hypothetical protein
MSMPMGRNPGRVSGSNWCSTYFIIYTSSQTCSLSFRLYTSIRMCFVRSAFEPTNLWEPFLVAASSRIRCSLFVASFNAFRFFSAASLALLSSSFSGFLFSSFSGLFCSCLACSFSNSGSFRCCSCLSSPLGELIK